MLAGMYVVRDETPTLVARITGPQRGPVHQGHTTYHLRALLPSGYMADSYTYLRDPEATDVPHLPACEDCGAPSGQPCAWVEPMSRVEWADEMLARAKGVTNTTSSPVRNHGF